MPPTLRHRVRNGLSFAAIQDWIDQAKYEKYQGQPDAARIQGEKLRKGKLFKNIKAHQKLSPSNATQLMQWIIDGAN